jgi:hypothetical protein
VRPKLQSLVISIAVAAATGGCFGQKRSFRSDRASGTASNEDITTNPKKKQSPTEEVVTSPEATPIEAKEQEPFNGALSLNSSVKWKLAETFERDLSEALDLSAEELCSEYGGKSCIREVHSLALGGIDPYYQGVFAPQFEPAANTPIVVNRIVLSACKERTTRDFAGSATIYKNLPLTAERGLTSLEAPEVNESIQRLYNRALLRMPTAKEIEVLHNLYRSIAQIKPTDAAQNWAMLSCFAVLTTTEFIFY